MARVSPIPPRSRRLRFGQLGFAVAPEELAAVGAAWLYFLVAVQYAPEPVDDDEEDEERRTGDEQSVHRSAAARGLPVVAGCGWLGDDRSRGEAAVALPPDHELDAFVGDDRERSWLHEPLLVRVRLLEERVA